MASFTVTWSVATVWQALPNPDATTQRWQLLTSGQYLLSMCPSPLTCWPVTAELISQKYLFPNISLSAFSPITVAQ